MFVLGNEGRWPWRENTRIQRNLTLEGSALRGPGDASQQLEEQSSRCSVSRGATLGSPSIQSYRQERTIPILEDKHRAPALEERADGYFSLDELGSKNLLASLIHLSSVLHWKEWELLHQYFQSPFTFCFLGSEVTHLATVNLPDFLQIRVQLQKKENKSHALSCSTDLL